MISAYFYFFSVKGYAIACRYVSHGLIEERYGSPKEEWWRTTEKKRPERWKMADCERHLVHEDEDRLLMMETVTRFLEDYRVTFKLNLTGWSNEEKQGRAELGQRKLTTK